ncbi:MAG: tripartite tricarboxylate transporter substrate binding protein [Betaproteobacteria bacterium]|nr:tripartite tricarboxylate transporter substrate binding protein [Betaproteobacteria bacterium]
MSTLVRWMASIVLMIGTFASTSVSAQGAYPNRPIRLIVAFAAGGVSDVIARALAAKLSNTIGQPVVVENKPGAASTLAGDFVAKSAADGYTIWLQDITSHSINATLYSKLPFDPIKDFAPITLVAWTPLMLVVHPSNPAKDLRELVAFLKTSGGKHAYGSSGSGSPNHLAGELLKTVHGLDTLHIPYKGSAPSTQAMLANEIAFVFSSMPPAVSNVKGGRLRALAVTSTKRVAAAPDVPTMVEAGMPNFDVVVYTGILAPAGTPAPIIQRLNEEFAKAVDSEEIKNVYEKMGADAITNTPEAFRAMIAQQIATMAPFVRASGAKAD